eukprot:scaffold5610_cov237-Skeletonema_marinoi.AAC.2
MPDKHEVDAANSSSPIAIVIVPANTKTKAKLNVKITWKGLNRLSCWRWAPGLVDHVTWTW